MHDNIINLKAKNVNKLNLFGINLEKNNSSTTRGTTLHFYDEML